MPAKAGSTPAPRPQRLALGLVRRLCEHVDVTPLPEGKIIRAVLRLA
ncbi:hypothetical protein [Streptomyces sp. NPDC051546]